LQKPNTPGHVLRFPLDAVALSAVLGSKSHETGKGKSFGGMCSSQIEC